MDSHNLRLEVGALKQLADAQPAVSRALFHWALAMVMVERGKARIVERRIAEGGELYSFASPEGEAVSLVRPAVSDAVLDEMLTAVRAILEEESRHIAPLDE